MTATKQQQQLAKATSWLAQLKGNAEWAVSTSRTLSNPPPCDTTSRLMLYQWERLLFGSIKVIERSNAPHRPPYGRLPSKDGIK
jgi:hypothetical protein